MIKLVRKDFRAWLVKNAGKIVGQPASTMSCPFCRYLKFRGAKNVSVGIFFRAVDGRTHEHCKWQRDFQKQAIKLQRELKVAGLRGGEAIEVLDNV